MSYTPKQQGTGGSAGQQSQQAAKTLAGITQQMQNLVHGQNAIPQTSQTAGLGAVNFANLNITLQQQQQQQHQRFESIIKQQQLLFSAATPQIQQHFQQQIQQQQNAAKDLLNKSLQQHHQQQANGSTASASLASNLANQQLHQQLQAFAQNPANLMQHLQAYQYQMQQQQQQHQQKILPLNQTQQSLATSQLDVQNVTQQHMQQIQQSLQQQKQLLAATHAKNVSSTNQMKPPPATPNNSNSFPLSNAAVQIQSNNNLPNKSSAKGVIPPVVTQVVKQAISSSNPAAKILPVQTTKTLTVPSSVIPKPATILPPTTKAPPVLYPQKSQNTPISLTRTNPNTVSNSSQSSKTPTPIQQVSRSTVSPHHQISAKSQDVQQTTNHGKSINAADVNKNPKQTLSAGKPEVLAAHPVQSSSNQAILNAASDATASNFEAKTNEDTKPEADRNIEKDKSVQSDQKEKHSSNSTVSNNAAAAAKEVIKVDIMEKTQENTEKQKQERDKDKEPINSHSIQQQQQQQQSTITVTTDSATSSNPENISKNDINTDQIDVSGKVSQKVNLRMKPNQRRNQTKTEKDKNDKVKAEKMKEKSEKDKCSTEKEKDGQDKKEKDQQQQQQQQHKEKVENNKITKDHDTKENNENDKTGKEKINKEKTADKNNKTTSKPERKRNFAKEVSASLNKQLKSGIQQQQQNLSSSVTSSSSNIDGRRSKRHRLKTILYQSPLPELAYITKLSVNEVSNSRGNEEKLILFYKLEYLAVRNAEGGFFICQTLQNVYKSSKRIRIRWFSEEKKDSTIYNPDFYDNTDLECVLTTVELEKMGKDRFKLPKAERSRIENILKKAMDVEKGITPRPNVTEENPDGLDISLLKVESQLSKVTSSGRKRVASKSPKGSRTKSLEKRKIKQKKKFDINEDSSQDDENDDEYDNNDKEYKPSRNKRSNISAGTEQLKLRAQRSPLAKTRQRNSPSAIIPNKKDGSSKQSNKCQPPQQKPPLSDVKKKENITENETVIPETHKTERPKRKAVESIISYDEELVAAKRLAATKQTKKNDETSSKINDKGDVDESVATASTAITSSKKHQTTNNELESISSSTNVKSSITSAAEVKVATIATAAAVAAETAAAPSTTVTAVTTTTAIKTANGGGTGVGISKKKKTFITPINKISNSKTTTGTSDKDKNTPQPHSHSHQTSSESSSVSSTPAISSTSSSAAVTPASSSTLASSSSATAASAVSRLTRSRK